MSPCPANQRPANQALPFDEQAALLALGRLPLIGPARGRRLLDSTGSAAAALSAPRSVWAKALGPSIAERARVSPDLAWARLELRRLADLGGELIGWGDASYPAWLAAISDAPLALYALGDKRHLRLPAIAIVGSRRCSSYGRRAAGQVAEELARRGMSIVSGLARGIDGAAHEGALRAAGSTIAVLGCGVDVIYPREHGDLYRRISQVGLLLAEAPLGTAPEARGFPRRNRIVSGLSLATIVAEAPHRSGALMTARLASEQGREVFAIPGEITNPRCAGCLELLRDGAGLVRGADDVVGELAAHLPAVGTDPGEHGLTSSVDPDGGPMVCPQDRTAEPLGANALGANSLSVSGRQLLTVMARGEHDVEELARQVGLTIEGVQQALLLLEVAGLVQRLPGQRYARAS